MEEDSSDEMSHINADSAYIAREYILEINSKWVKIRVQGKKAMMGICRYGRGHNLSK
jgi:hypothetical protein